MFESVADNWTHCSRFGFCFLCSILRGNSVVRLRLGEHSVTMIMIIHSIHLFKIEIILGIPPSIRRQIMKYILWAWVLVTWPASDG